MNPDPKQAPVLLAAAIFVLTILVYLPARNCGFIWDDQDYVTENETLRTLDGLKRIWIEPGAVPQYYPLVHTMFWVEFQLWGLNPKGYHIVNVLLHALNAALVFLLLRGLQAPGAWLAGAIFALHPVHVESVAWITERKNVLSLFFYLLAAFMYLRFDAVTQSASFGTAGLRGAARRSYLAAGVLYVCALLSKTVTCSLPAALLLLLYWKRGRLTRRDVMPLAPYFIVGIAFGLLTAWMERTQVGAVGRFWEHTMLERFLIAGRVVWFYAGKLIYPYPLSFVYPRWTIDQEIAWLYLFPAAALALVASLWLLRRRIGRAPLVAVLFFGGTLFPAMGFINVYPMRYSYVADHFQYHASLGLIALAAAGISLLGQRLALARLPAGNLAGIAVLMVLAALTWRQLPVYRDYETVFRDALKKSPDSTLALTSVAAINVEQGRRDQAIELYRRALALDELDEVAHFNLGKVLLDLGDIEGAQRHLARSWSLTPDCAHCHYFHALALSIDGRLTESLVHYEQAIALDPGEAFQHYNYGVTLLRMEKTEAAEKALGEALRLKPDMLNARLAIAHQHMEAGRWREAETFLLAGLPYHPHEPGLHDMLKTVRAAAQQPGSN